jgi:hypothetical protein
LVDIPVHDHAIVGREARSAIEPVCRFYLAADIALMPACANCSSVAASATGFSEGGERW